MQRFGARRRSSGRRSARDVVATSAADALPPVSLRRAAIASRSLTRCPSAVTPSCFRCSSVRLRRTVSVYLVLAECSLILSKAKAPQPDHDVHDGRPNSGLLHIIVRSRQSVQEVPDGRFSVSISVGVKTVPRSVATYLVPISARRTIGNCAKISVSDHRDGLCARRRPLALPIADDDFLPVVVSLQAKPPCDLAGDCDGRGRTLGPARLPVRVSRLG